MKKQNLSIVALLLFTQLSAGNFIKNYNGNWTDSTVTSLVLASVCAALFVYSMVNLKNARHE